MHINRIQDRPIKYTPLPPQAQELGDTLPVSHAAFFVRTTAHGNGVAGEEGDVLPPDVLEDGVHEVAEGEAIGGGNFGLLVFVLG